MSLIKRWNRLTCALVRTSACTGSVGDEEPGVRLAVWSTLRNPVATSRQELNKSTCTMHTHRDKHAEGRRDTRTRERERDRTKCTEGRSSETTDAWAEQFNEGHVMRTCTRAIDEIVYVRVSCSRIPRLQENKRDTMKQHLMHSKC